MYSALFSFLSFWNSLAVRDLPFTPSLPLTVRMSPVGKEINIYWTLQRIIRFSPQSPSQVTIVLIPIAQMRKLRCRVKLQAQDHMIGKCQKPGPCHTYSVDSTRGWGGAPFYLNSPHLHHEDSSEFSVSLRRCPNSYSFLFLSQGLSHLIIRHCILTPHHHHHEAPK